MSRIIFVNRYFHPDVSATSQMLGDLVFRLAAAGQDVHVVCSRQLYEDADKGLQAVDRIAGVGVRRLWTSSFGRRHLLGRALDYATFHCGILWYLLCHLRRGDIVVAKTDPPLIGVTVGLAAQLRGARLVNWLQDVFPEVAIRLSGARAPRLLASGLAVLRDASLRHAVVNVAIGSRMAEYLHSRGIPKTRLMVIENWADSVFVRPLAPSASILRRELGLLDAFIVGYSGNLGRAHDVTTLVAAARQLTHLPGLVFLVVGGGAGYEALRESVLDLGLDANFRFLPYQPRGRLADSLAAADVHLASLRADLEGLIVPSKVYGIFAAGRPVIFIGDPQGEVGRKLAARGCGLNARGGDPGELVAAIRRLHGDAELCRSMGLRAATLHLDHHTAESGAASWAALLSAVDVAASPLMAAQGAGNGKH